MVNKLKVDVVPLNAHVKNIAQNVHMIKEVFLNSKADLTVTPELSVTGYPLRDAVENPDLLDASERALEELKTFTKGHGKALVVGFPVRRDGKIYNCSFVLKDGEVLECIEKTHRPNYGVFDEVRNFESGENNNVFTINGVTVGLLICEDTWEEDVAKDLVDQGADILISTNASPYETGKYLLRRKSVVAKRVAETQTPMIYLNQLGGQDELYFDGGAFMVTPDQFYELAPRFTDDVGSVSFVKEGQGTLKIEGVKESLATEDDLLHDDYTMIMLAVRDYAKKTGLTKVCLGMSGGVDSALVAAIAVDALGAENVSLYSMPSKFTSDESNSLAYDEAKRLGCSIQSMSIQDIVNAFQKTILPLVDNDIKRITIENFQARTRGTLLMGIANNNPGTMVLSTGNKSENAVGYATLYGDMNGGYNPLKDVLKTRVFELCEWRNKNKPKQALGPEGEVIPVGIITRPPTAELFEDQKDSDNLPPYDILDELIVRYAEQEQRLGYIAEVMDQPIEFVTRWTRAIDFAQYKRAQSCPGPKIRPRDFHSDRRYPIAASPTSELIT